MSHHLCPDLSPSLIIEVTDKQMSGHYSQTTDDLSAHAPSHHCCVINDPAVIQRDDAAFVNLLCGDVTRSSCFRARFSPSPRADVRMPVTER